MAREEMRMKKKKSPKQIAALVCVILLVLLYIVTLVAAFFTKVGGMQLFKICAILTIAIPVFCWAFIWMYGKLTGKRTIADPPEPKLPEEEVTDDQQS